MKQLTIAVLVLVSMLTVSIGPASAGKISARPSVTTGLDGTETIGIIKDGLDMGTTTKALGITQNVMAFGAVCDGVTNDAAAIQAVLDAATTNTRIVIPGICGIGTAGLAISSKTNLTIDGEGRGGFRLDCQRYDDTDV